MSTAANVPVIAIDGPVGSGKGTIARRVATALGWHLLDSGALYRLVALAAAKLGARRVWAVDNDAQALEATRRNAAANGVELIFDGRDLSERDFGVFQLISRRCRSRTGG